ncbi:type I-E CRISPR-associated protein Cas6/Cse3/CasE [Deinococcus sp. HMF7604]|uniref:type I-E CRISPR-associated protein Cas6/Cse3/CasE n=1 Tax=Deinococcus betulae TaxID=2873312 RepID=UPI001CCD9DEC|nr:type I-E CRISPR-associated protein Cas6/Cse3/CasE [Deinococcus betulae]MBZ9751899.1 type I-E CRISPR-associated protein Cas6/Cse3/CasE [Deinococcus betulae]
MYLSHLFLSERHRQAAGDLRSAYGLHQTLRWGFPGAGEAGVPLPGGERLLWRKDTWSEDGQEQAFIVCQSVTHPDWQAVEDRWPGYFRRAPEVKVLDLGGLRTGDQLRFRLRANVTVSRFRDGQDRERDPRTKREALRGAREQLAWLDRQGERGGFRVLGADIAQSGNVRLYKSANPRPLTLFAVTFEGVLHVEDTAQLGQTVGHGLGKAKALGFGLLSLARR